MRSIATVMRYARRLRRFTSVEAGDLTIWSPQIFETDTVGVISRGDVAERSAGARSLQTEIASDRPPGGRHGYELSDFTGVRSIFRSLFRYDLGLLVRGTAAGSKRPSRVKAGYSVFERSGCRFA